MSYRVGVRQITRLLEPSFHSGGTLRFSLHEGVFWSYEHLYDRTLLFNLFWYALVSLDYQVFSSAHYLWVQA